MTENHRFWGVLVKPGETVKCDPGELYYHISLVSLDAGKGEENVQVFVNVNDERIMLGTLSVDNHPHVLADLVFNKEFELSHSSMTSDISFTGYKFDIVKRYHSCTKQGDESDEEVPLAIPLDFNTDGCKNNEATHSANKLTAPRPATVQETYSPGKQKGDDEDKTDAQDPSDGVDDKSSVKDVDYSQKKRKGENNPVETPLKTPQGKKAKIATPTTGNKTGYVHVATPHPAAKPARKTSDHVHVATPHPSAKQARKSSDHVHVATPHPSAKQARKTSDHVHVATPHPSAKNARKTSDHVHVATPHPSAKHARKTPEYSDDKSKQLAGHVCGLCDRTFSSWRGLEDHSRVKHSAAK